MCQDSCHILSSPTALFFLAATCDPAPSTVRLAAVEAVEGSKGTWGGGGGRVGAEEDATLAKDGQARLNQRRVSSGLDKTARCAAAR
jgi:hypothetical protein